MTPWLLLCLVFIPSVSWFWFISRLPVHRFLDPSCKMTSSPLSFLCSSFLLYISRPSSSLFLHSLLSHLSEHLCCKLTKDEPESDHMTHRSVLMSPAISPVYTDTIIDPFPALTMNAVFWLAVFWCICTDLNITVWSVFVLCVSLKSKLSNLQHQEDPWLYCWYQHCLTDRF